MRGAKIISRVRARACFPSRDSQLVSTDIKPFVLHTGPLIALAAAECLDYLLFVAAAIVIPDAVFYEATHDAARLGTQDVLDWVKLNHGHVELAPTPT